MHRHRTPFFFLFLLFIPFLTFAQNLVPNGSFENVREPSNGHADLENAFHWLNPSDSRNQRIAGTPDLLTEVADTPYRELQYSLSPQAGKNCVGLITYLQRVPDFREYASVQLTGPLKVGETYQLSFWLSNGDKTTYGNIGTNHFGVLLSEKMPSQHLRYPINASPQWSQKKIFFKYGWQKIEFTFKADKAFRFLTFGNFKNDAQTQKQYFRFDIDPQAYIFIDEVNLIPFQEKNTEEKEEENIEVVELEKENKKEKSDLEKRKVEVQRMFSLGAEAVKIKIWDDREEDGDVITLIFNGVVILDKYALTNKKKTIELTMSGADLNELVLYANDMGKEPPCTAAFHLKSGKNQMTYRIKSNLQNSGAIRFIRE